MIELCVGHRRQILMVPAVVSDVMSLSDDTPCDIRIHLHIPADQEERGLQAVFLQRVEHHARVGSRAIVESQCDEPAAAGRWWRGEKGGGRKPPTSETEMMMTRWFAESLENRADYCWRIAMCVPEEAYRRHTRGEPQVARVLRAISCSR